MHNSQILWESASSLFTLHSVEAVQNLAAFASRDGFMAPLLDHFLSPPQPYLAVRERVTSLTYPLLPMPFELLLTLLST